MLRNYFTIALRNLRKHSFYSALNILGLGIGIAAFLFILLYTRHELSYDKYHPAADRIVRIDFMGRLGENEINGATNPAALGPALLDEYPEVETYCRFRQRGSFLMKYEDRHFKEQDVVYVDSTFFDMFGVGLREGDPGTALSEPRSIVISAELVEKYFVDGNAMGKSLVLDNGDSYEITGVMYPIPENTHFNYDFLLSMSTLDESRDVSWGSFNFNTYVRLAPGTDRDAFLANAQATFKRNFEAVLRDYVGTTWDEFMSAGNYAYYELMNLTDIHLQSDRQDELAANGDRRYVTIFSIIGFFILAIAGINFVNLSTARSVQRAREVGVRKVIGAERVNLIGQFLSESVLTALLAAIVAGGLIYVGLPYFNDLAGKSFGTSDLFSAQSISIGLGIAALTGLLSGIYPAMYLSGFEPVKVLKGGEISSTNRSLLRNALVVFQFFITTVLIIGTAVVTRQLHFMQNKKIGYDREQVLVLNDAYALGEQTETFKQRMLEHPDVQYASVTGFLPVRSSRNFSSFFKGRNPAQENAILMGNWRVDFDYIKTMGMEVIEGRDFDASRRTDSMAILINEELARQLGYDDPVGQVISNFRGESTEELEHFEIIGVVKDFHFDNLRQSILPLALFIGRHRGAISMRLTSSADISGFIADLKETWDEMAPGQPFEYQFMDARFERMFEAEVRMGKIVAVFAFLAIFVACMGLLGLATYIAQQRTKEIGIRKVLGASTSNLVYLLCKDFGLLIGISFILAIPLGWYLMSNWLADFAYATSMGVGVFIVSGLLVLAVAVLSIFYQAARVAVIDPVETLKWE